MSDSAPAPDAGANAPARPWMLPGELAGVPREGRRVRRTRRDWLVDAGVFSWCLLWWLLIAGSEDQGHLAEWVRRLDAPLGLLYCAAVWLRRRFPLALAIAALPAAAFVNSAFGMVLVVLLNTALRLPWRTARVMLALLLAAVLPYLVLYTVPYEGGWVAVGFVLAFSLAFFAWGLAIRARRRELLRLRTDAERERAEHVRRLADTRRAERETIAREMHDVLAHRISLLSVHAGALAYRTGATPAGAPPLSSAEIADTAQLIRDTAHQALEELRDVLTVLRGGEGGGAAGERPQPVIADIPELVREAEAAGQCVDRQDTTDAAATGALPARLQRTVYRVVQEGLTNARKHAPGAPVAVGLSGGPGAGLTVVLRNPLPEDADGQGATTGIPGAGAGLTGLAERTELEGGTLEHGHAGGLFTLRARLPWPG